MKWRVIFHEAFKDEYEGFPNKVKRKLTESIETLEELGPLTGKPLVDTLKGSKYNNLKEIRFRGCLKNRKFKIFVN